MIYLFPNDQSLAALHFVAYAEENKHLIFDTSIVKAIGGMISNSIFKIC